MIAALVTCILLTLTPAHVMRVIDGDTFVVYDVNTPPEERIRILGVDTPERGDSLYAEAKAFTAAWIGRGSFNLEACKRDVYGRLLATVWRDADTLSVSLIAAGLGVPYGR